jgi:hypothetical protein
MISQQYGLLNCVKSPISAVEFQMSFCKELQSDAGNPFVSFTDDGMMRLESKRQFPKGDFPKFVTPSGIVILVIDLQPSKAESPMLVTLSGIVTFVNEVQSSKAQYSILVTPSGMTT